MNQKLGTIYIATNLLNRKQYVGQTTRDLKERIYNHKINKNKKLILSKAIRKYGIENFKWISFSCFEKDLDWTESFLIRELKTLVPNGYNLETGGHKNKHSHKSTRRKISEIRIKNGIAKGKNNPMFGKIGELSPHWGKKCPEKGQPGEKNYFYGKHLKHTEEWKQNKSRQTKGENNPSAVLTMENVSEIRALLKENNLSLKKIAKLFNISAGTIWKIKVGRIWKQEKT